MLAVITGGTSKLGKILVENFTKQGFNVVFTYHNDRPEVSKLESEKVISYKLNLEDPQGCQSFMEWLFEKYKQVDIFINNAALYTYDTSLENTNHHEVLNYLQVNSLAPLTFINSLNNHKSTAPCHIINILDADICRNKTNRFPYILSKKLLKEVTLMCAANARPHLRINAISPGVIDFDYDRNGNDKELSFWQEYSHKVPLKTQPHFTDILQAIEFVLHSKLITGQILNVDGGLSIS